ncbi:MAG: hypothetical protein ACYDHM_12035 [Acidiferrobacterales bacterium]
MGWIYLERHDYARAFQAFAAGAALDDPPAIYDLRVLYRRGLGVGKQPEKARALFERAAALGNLFAKRDLALLLLCGHAGFLARFKGFLQYLSSTKEFSRVLAQDPSSARRNGQIASFHQYRLPKTQ